MRTLITLFAFFLITFVHAQDVKDTCIRRIERVESPKRRAIEYNNAAIRGWYSGDYRATLVYTDYGLKIAREHKFLDVEAELLNNRGIAYDYLNQYSLALENYFAALRVQEKLDNPQMEANILGNIGLIYGYQDRSEKALEYHNKSLRIQRKLGNATGVSASLNNLAIIHADMGNYEKAIENYKECIRIDTKLKDTTGLGDDYNNIAISYIDLKKYDLALFYLNKSLAIRTNENNEVGIAKTLTNFGTLYYKMQDAEKAKPYFLRATELALKNRDLETLSYAYQHLSLNADMVADSAEAYNYYKLYIMYRDSIDNSEMARKQTELELNYQFDKEKEVAQLKQQEKDRQQFLMLASVSSGLVLILLFSILFFHKWKQTQRQRKIIEEKNMLVQQKNDEIMDSINYAKRIQHAILPSENQLSESFAEHFVYFAPKDIVSGDFYWMDALDELVVFAVADCTGHGVPGALMSVVCHNALSRSLREFALKDPAAILNQTRVLVIQELSKSDGSMADGMDISLCVFKRDAMELQWAGANNPIWIYRAATGSLEELKGDKQPIGNHVSMNAFSSHQIRVEPNDCLYLFSDGFADQFGGALEKKFMSKNLKAWLQENAHLPCDDQKNLLEETFKKWKGNLEQIDDVCIVGLKLKAV